MPAATATRMAVLDRLRSLDPRDENWQGELSALSLGLVDAILQADVQALEAAPEVLRDVLARMFEDTGHAREIRGWLLGALAFTEWSLQRLPSPAEYELLHDTQGYRFLKCLSHEGDSLTGSELRERLGVDDSSLSRTGRKLLGRGLVIQRRLGRTARWELTPRGRQLLRELDEVVPSDDGAAAAEAGRSRGRSRRRA